LYDKPSGDDLEWWNMAQLAKWAGVPLWDLIKQPYPMIRKLSDVMEVEQKAREAMMKRSKK
jgi:hypothetical protein